MSRQDRTITRASRAGIRTIPVERGYPKRPRGNIRLHPDDIAAAVEMARQDRIEADIKAYKQRKSA